MEINDRFIEDNLAKININDNDQEKAINPRNEVVDKIINFMESHRREIGKKQYENSLEIFNGIKKINDTLTNTTVFQDACRDKKLQDTFDKITHMKIHGPANFPNFQIFEKNMQAITDVLNNVFPTLNEHQKLQFFNYALNNAGCFEGRVEGITEFIMKINDIGGSLIYEIKDFKKSSNKPESDAVSLDELIAFLESQDFFNIHNIKEEELRIHPCINDLTYLGYLKGPELTLLNRIDGEFGTFIEDNMNTGIEKFKSYLIKTLELTPEEIENLDKTLDDYFNSVDEVYRDSIVKKP